MNNCYDYNEYIDIEILKFLWSKIGEEVKIVDIFEEIIKPNDFHTFELSNVRHHTLALLEENLIKTEDPIEPLQDSIIEITPDGLKTLRNASLIKEACTSIEVIYAHLVNNQNDL